MYHILCTSIIIILTIVIVNTQQGNVTYLIDKLIIDQLLDSDRCLDAMDPGMNTYL